MRWWQVAGDMHYSWAPVVPWQHRGLCLRWPLLDLSFPPCGSGFWAARVAFYSQPAPVPGALEDRPPQTRQHVARVEEEVSVGLSL